MKIATNFGSTVQLQDGYCYLPSELHDVDLSRLLSYTDPLGARTTYRYNSIGEPIQRIDANSNTLDYAYDAVGRLISLTNENGDSTTFRYDLADQLTDEIGFDGRHQRYCYNAAGELTHLIEAGTSHFGPGKVTRFERDALGRLFANIK